VAKRDRPGLLPGRFLFSARPTEDTGDETDHDADGEVPDNDINHDI